MISKIEQYNATNGLNSPENGVLSNSWKNLYLEVKTKINTGSPDNKIKYYDSETKLNDVEMSKLD